MGKGDTGQIDICKCTGAASTEQFKVIINSHEQLFTYGNAQSVLKIQHLVYNHASTPSQWCT